MDGLFNYQTPQALQQQYLTDRQLSAAQMAQLPLLNQVAAMGGNTGAALGTSLGRLFGGRTAAEVENEAMKEIFTGAAAQTEDPVERMTIAAKGLRQRGLEGRAIQLEQEAAKLQQTRAATQKSQADAQRAAQAAAREEQLRERLSQLPPDATDKDVEVAVREFGNPDQIFKAMERRQTAEANRQAKAELEREKAERAEAARQERMQFQQTMAMLAAQQREATNALQREKIQQQIDATKAKQQESADKKQMALDMSIRHANKVITDVNQAKELVSTLTTGLPGKAASMIPGTDAFNLNQRVLTLKANLGFDRLQQMREASPTGGALGQVAVQELEALQASVGSLEVGQSRNELLQNLNKIDKHYRAWLNAVQGARGVEAQGTPAPTPVSTTSGWSIRPVN